MEPLAYSTSRPRKRVYASKMSSYVTKPCETNFSAQLIELINEEYIRKIATE